MSVQRREQQRRGRPRTVVTTTSCTTTNTTRIGHIHFRYRLGGTQRRLRVLPAAAGSTTRLGDYVTEAIIRHVRRLVVVLRGRPAELLADRVQRLASIAVWPEATGGGGACYAGRDVTDETDSGGDYCGALQVCDAVASAPRDVDVKGQDGSQLRPDKGPQKILKVWVDVLKILAVF